jgi:hypothetical protein
MMKYQGKLMLAFRLALSLARLKGDSSNWAIMQNAQWRLQIEPKGSGQGLYVTVNRLGMNPKSGYISCDTAGNHNGNNESWLMVLRAIDAIESEEK